ncbi:hypothetical protein [Gloeocapsa sp. PCC 73106]|uniref:hypothetical protein n=1 Tax=Gloeocapsa sp. PCC 73106 TaxID=102232 RepID=UPI0002ACB4CC|nr:hypothetical protein [Gloeocapsa sp. PCC 73106]ELR98893.1 hypothetical protein GLO73106DRAFT_00027320 [Gloeocapsa sp. PCC 73106]
MTSNSLSSIPKRERVLVDVKQDKSAKTFKYKEVNQEKSQKKQSWWHRLIKKNRQSTSDSI